MRRSIDPWALILLALILLMLPIRWIIAWLTAAAFHELCHCLAVRLCGGRVVALDIHSHGARLEAWGMGRFRAVACVLAGPIGSMLLVLAARWTPALSLCGALQGAFNLLPLRSLDGGRALALLLPSTVAPRVLDLLEKTILTCLWLLAAYGTIAAHLGLMPLFLAFIMHQKVNTGKRPCKASRFGVQ